MHRFVHQRLRRVWIGPGLLAALALASPTIAQADDPKARAESQIAMNSAAMITVPPAVVAGALIPPTGMPHTLIG